MISLSENSFSKKYRLRKKTGYIIKKGHRKAFENIIIYYMVEENPKLAVIISSKVTNSVGRNRIKRWTREFFRKNKNKMDNYGIILVYKKKSEKMKNEELCNKLNTIFFEAGIYKT
ncbi:ribonuclease P protein component [Elusimicrobiota bacterium]